MIKTLKNILKYLLPVSLLFTGFSFSQEINFKAIQIALENEDYSKLKSEFEEIDTLKTTTYDKAIWLYHYSHYQSDIPHLHHRD